ncbi:syntaxin-12 [Atheta coriaria]|uniref:syntaxin-12 n=1 Tax=Dalotia coriaria TaxID=877792 RepID=UPI0031F44142
MNRNAQTSYGTMASTSEVQFSGQSGSQDFANLCDEISNQIYKISQSWKTLEASYKRIGTAKDSEAFRDTIHETQLSANEAITVTKGKISIISIQARNVDKAQKLQLERLTESFKEVIARYSATQKKVADKLKSNFLVRANIEYENVVENADQFQQQQQQQQVLHDMAFENDMHLDREMRIRQIEADVIDVNQIMRELGSLVHEQGQTIDTIENSIDYATGHVEEGAAQLLKASGYQSRYRRRLCILVFIATVVAIILVAILVTQLKN